MDQAAPESQKFLGTYTQCSQDPTLLCHYCLVAIVGKELKIGRSTYEILQILGISLLGKTLVKELLANNDYKNVKELDSKQLSLSLF